MKEGEIFPGGGAALGQRRARANVEKRRLQRSKQRLVCEIVVEGKSFPGIVRDLSRSGLFVQTRAKPETNSVVEVVFAAGDASQPEIRLEAGVARQRDVQSGLQHSVPAGVGLEVLDPPETFFELVEAQSHAVETPSAQADGAAAVLRTFRVRLTQTGKPGSRIETIRCENAAGARARALSRAGRGWKITELQEI